MANDRFVQRDDPVPKPNESDLPALQVSVRGLHQVMR